MAASTNATAAKADVDMEEEEDMEVDVGMEEFPVPPVVPPAPAPKSQQKVVDPDVVFKKPLAPAPRKKEPEPPRIDVLPPESQLSMYIQDFVDSVTIPGTRPVFVRELSSMSKSRKLTTEEYNFLQLVDPKFPNCFPYTSRAIMAFQKTENGYAGFFMAYFQEYDHHCPLPNRDCIYLTILDSVNVTEQRSQKTHIIKSILVAYFSFVGILGFKYLFLWAAPPSDATVQYIFPGKPKSQKIPDITRLVEWYATLFDWALTSRTIKDSYTYHHWFTQGPGNVFMRFPMFDEDFLPVILETAFKDFEKKKWKTEPTEEEKNKQKVEFVKKKVMENIGGFYKDHLFVVELKADPDDQSRVLENYMDYERPSMFVDHRDYLVNFLKMNDLNFATVEEAEKSTYALLYQLWEETNTNKYIYCDLCTEAITDGYTCRACDLDACSRCVDNRFTSEHTWIKRIKYSTKNPPQETVLESPVISQWKRLKSDWWQSFKDQRKDGSENAKNISDHIKNCKAQRHSCALCIRFRELGYVELKKTSAALSVPCKNPPTKVTRRRIKPSSLNFIQSAHAHTSDNGNISSTDRPAVRPNVPRTC